MKEVNKYSVSEHVLEIRHQACGRFLDMRGSVADHIRGADLFSHWEIDTNVVNFRDDPEKPKKIGAFAGYSSAGVFVYDPVTRNFFEDKAGQFWKTLSKNQFYTIPEITRYGCRTKVFLNSEKKFEEINNILYSKFFSSNLINLMDNKIKDFQVVLELTESDFSTRIICGPIHKDEAKRYFNSQSEHFSETGIYIDVDIFKNQNIQHSDIPSLTKRAMEIAWLKIDNISESVGL